ncbi:MAG: hypothetical protein KF729_04660 [Sandaracinaceae bacterium]|nr:hypothetical protein [Sandaracinaceae bacterium]
MAHPLAYLLLALALEGPAVSVALDDHAHAADVEDCTSPCLAGEDSSDERSEVGLAALGRPTLWSSARGLLVHVEPPRAHRDAVVAHAARGPPAR